MKTRNSEMTGNEKTNVNKHQKLRRKLETQQKEILEILTPIYDEFVDLVEFGETFLLFDSAINALACVLKVKNAVQEFNNGPNQRMVIEATGFGLHIGNVLFFPQTFVCFGDCINTASKLGQDMADELDIWMSEQVFELVKHSKKYKELNQVKFVPTKKNIKGQIVTYYNVVKK